MGWAMAWRLRVGGPWQALPTGDPHWRTVYGWFRRWGETGLVLALMRHVARLRRPARSGRRAGPRLAVVDPRSVEAIPVRGPRGVDAAKRVVGRRMALVDADGVRLALAVVSVKGTPGQRGFVVVEKR